MSYAIGEGFKARIEEKGLKALGPETYFGNGYSFVLTDKGPLYYSEYENQVVGPFEPAD
jgi:hypothetical protein